MINSKLGYAPFYDEKMDLMRLSPFEKAKHSILRLLLTPRGTDSYDEGYGASVRDMVFDLDGTSVLETIRRRIQSQLKLYEPEIEPYTQVSTSYFNESVYGKVFIVIEVTLINMGLTPIRIMVDTKRKKDFVINGGG